MRTIYSFIVVVIIGLLFSSCARKLTFASSPVLPAAEGKVKIKKDDNQNYIVSVDITRLAKPNSLTPPKEVYVVWMESDGNRTRNIGQINPSSGLFSKTLKGSLKATATARPTRIFLTAEDNGNVQYPGSQRVLITE